MNRAAAELRKQGVYAVSVEFSEATGEYGLCEQIIEGFIRLYGANQGLRTKISPQRVQRLIQDYVMRKDPLRVVVLIDEADLLNERCPELTAVFRLCHNNGWAKFVFFGFRKLKKAVNDRTNSIMANFAVELPIGGLDIRACGSLIAQPLGELGIQLSNLEEVVRTIHHETAGSPSRIQLLCHFIVESLDGASSPIVGKEEALAVMKHPEVRKFINAWFFESTTPTMRWLAAVATLYMPCTELALVDHATRDFHEITGFDVKSDINDLMTANILEYKPDGNLDFSFPAMRDVARPRGAANDTVAELRKTALRFRQGSPR
jgi:hypothetical protein